MYRTLALLSLIVLSQAGAPANTSDLQFDKNSFFDFVKGFLVGIGTDLNLQDIVTCYDDVDQGIKYALDAEKYCKGTGIWNKTKCLYYKAKALGDLPGAITSCKASLKDAATIKNAIEEVENPISVVYNVGKEFVINGGEIYDQFTTGCKDWDNGDFYDSGVEFGRVFGIIFGADGSSLAAVNGFLKGSETTIQLSDIYECGEYMELSKNFMEVGLNLVVESQTELDVKGSLKFINAYYRLILESAKNCEQDENQIEWLEGKITIASNDDNQRFENNRIYISGNDVTKYLAVAALELNSQQYHLAGMHLGKMLVMLEDNETAFDFAKGLLRTSGVNVSDFSLQSTCLEVFQDIIMEVLELASNISSTNWNIIYSNLISIKNDLNNILSSCSPGEQLYSQLGNIHDFDKTKVLYYLTSGNNRLAAGDFERAGFFFGMAMNEMSGKGVVAFPAGNEKVLEIIEGIVKGMSSDVTVEDFQACVVDAENIGHEVYSAVQLLKSGSIANVKQALQDFGDAISSVPGMIDDCTNAFEDSNILSEAIKVIQNPYSFVFHIGKSLLFNGKEIYGDIESAVDAWESQDWYGFGFNMGHALKVVV